MWASSKPIAGLLEVQNWQKLIAEHSSAGNQKI